MTQEVPPQNKLKSILECLLFLSEKPLGLGRLKEILTEYSEVQIKEALTLMMAEKASSESGIELTEVAHGFQLRTKAENSAWIFRLNKARPVRLSRAALETLSIVAYRQPVTRPEVDDIRGVDCGPVLRNLLEKNLVKILGKREEPGNPLIYGTTPDFLEFFGFSNLSELPPLKEYTELGKESLEKLEKLLPPQTTATPTDETSAQTQSIESAPEGEFIQELAHDDTSTERTT